MRASTELRGVKPEKIRHHATNSGGLWRADETFFWFLISFSAERFFFSLLSLAPRIAQGFTMFSAFHVVALVTLTLLTANTINTMQQSANQHPQNGSDNWHQIFGHSPRTYKRKGTLFALKARRCLIHASPGESTQSASSQRCQSVWRGDWWGKGYSERHLTKPFHA